jgi:hypothetical protein
MTSIDRASFCRDLSGASITHLPPAVSKAFEAAHIKPEELKSYADKDGVIRDESQCNRLYQALVDAEAREPKDRGRIDHALEVYRAMKAEHPPEASAPPPLSASARPRTTGLLAIDVSRAGTVRSLGESARASLDEAAKKNVLSPEAQLQKRLAVQTEATATRLEELEAKAKTLPRNSEARAALDNQMDAIMNEFKNRIVAERAELGGQGQGSQDPARVVTNVLPPYLRESVKRDGLAIPGAKTGAISPRFGGTPGFDLKFKF